MTHNIDNNSNYESEKLAEWVGLPSKMVLLALESRAPRIVISGRLASGKDTLAEAVMKELGREDSVRISFATALRAEIDEILSIIRNSPNVSAAKTAVAKYSNLPTEVIGLCVDLLYTANAIDGNITAYSRTPEMRLALQNWGTEVRRAQDVEYWVKQGVKAAIETLANGNSVHITDARFANEVQICQSLNFWAIRLDVTSTTRAQRLMQRDGLPLNVESENHSSELELENYSGFDQRIENNGSISEAVDLILSKMPRLTL